MRGKIYLVGFLLVIIGFVWFANYAPKASENVSSGFSADVDRLIDFNNTQKVYIDSDNPLRGVLSEKGVLANTGKAIKEESNYLGNIINNIFTAVAVILFIGVAVWIWFGFRSRQ